MTFGPTATTFRLRFPSPCGVIASGVGRQVHATGTCPTRRFAADGGAAPSRPRPASGGAAPTACKLDTCFPPSRPAGYPDRDQPPSNFLAVADPVRAHAAIGVRVPAWFRRGDGGGSRDHAGQRHLGAVVRRLPSGQLRHLRCVGRLPRLRHHRFRRDAAGTVRMGRQAACRQRRGRCAQTPDAAAGVLRSRSERGDGLSPAHGETDAARSAAGMAIARGYGKRNPAHRRCKVATARTQASAYRGRGASQWLP